MLFSSISFIFFFLPLVLSLYYFSPSIRAKNIVLLILSLFFYAWGEPKYILVMILSILANYYLGLSLFHNINRRTKRIVLLVIAVVANLSVLFVFKYLGFSITLVNHIFELFNITPAPVIKLIMPIGISFYTFQSISYIIDVYRNPSLVQRNVLDLGLYITFFPQLIAGPIVRYHDINYQIKLRTHSSALFNDGIERFIIGLSKKVLLANFFGEITDGIYSLPFESYDSYYSWIAIISYSFQIYYDFSGYSDMAIGLGKMFGFNFLENFNYPYSAKTITDFWHRWHISLSSWFKDYVYIPLGGNRKGNLRRTLNLFIVFFITGLWHGASINFILWGLGHGILLYIEKTWINIKKIKHSIVTDIFLRLYTLISVMLLWIFFRNGTKKSLKLILKMFGVSYFPFSHKSYVFNNDPGLFLLVDKRFYIIFLIGFIFSFPWWKSIIKYKECNTILFVYGKKMLLLILFVLSVASLANNSYNPFIYFRF